MANIDTNQLLYVAGIGLLFNILLFTVTFIVVYLCKYPREILDLEANNEGSLNAALLGDDDDDDEEKKEEKRLIGLIPAMKFRQVVAFSGGDNGCCICLKEGFEEEEECKVLPECRHVFHSHCIDQWFNTKRNCPVCRKAFRVVVQPVSSFTAN